MSRAALLGVVLLAACTPEPVAENRATPAPDPTPAMPVAATPTASPSAIPTPEQADTLSTIPAEFHGLWSLPGTQCAGDSDGELTITADRLRFYESTARPRSVQVERPGKARLDLSFEGEGEVWRELAELELLDGGKRLRRASADFETIYNRCPSESEQ